MAKDMSALKSASQAVAALGAAFAVVGAVAAFA
jgi:hypothetical protein